LCVPETSKNKLLSTVQSIIALAHSYLYHVRLTRKRWSGDAGYPLL
jgi:hypothetical protein